MRSHALVDPHLFLYNMYKMYKVHVVSYKRCGSMTNSEDLSDRLLSDAGLSGQVAAPPSRLPPIVGDRWISRSWYGNQRTAGARGSTIRESREAGSSRVACRRQRTTARKRVSVCRGGSGSVYTRLPLHDTCMVTSLATRAGAALSRSARAFRYSKDPCLRNRLIEI